MKKFSLVFLYSNFFENGDVEIFFFLLCIKSWFGILVVNVLVWSWVYVLDICEGFF